MDDVMAEHQPPEQPAAESPAGGTAGANQDCATGSDAVLAQARAEVEALRNELRDQQLRNLAELDNVRKRAQREVAASTRLGAERLLRDLLAIADSLDLGLKAARGPEATSDSIVEGLDLTDRQFVGVLEKHGVVPVDPLGEPFNADLHEAVAMIESSAVAANHVVEVMQKGYRLHERLLRPARVVVARAPAAA